MSLRNISEIANMTGVVLQALVKLVEHQEIDISSIKLQATDENGEDVLDSDVALEDLLTVVYQDLDMLKDGHYVLVSKEDKE